MYKCLLDEVKVVAMKVLTAANGRSLAGIPEAQLAQFQSEINIMRACRFENVVAFLGANLEQVRALHKHTIMHWHATVAKHTSHESGSAS